MIDIEKKHRSKLIFIGLIVIMILIVSSLIFIVPGLFSRKLDRPDSLPDMRGEVLEKVDNEMIIIQEINRTPDGISYGGVYNLTIDDNSNIFKMIGREERSEDASINDINIGTKVSVWVIQGSNGTFYVTDIGIMGTRLKNVST